MSLINLYGAYVVTYEYMYKRCTLGIGIIVQ